VLGANYYCLVDIAFLDATVRDRLLNADLDDVPYSRVAALGAPKHLNTLNPARTAVVGDAEVALHLNHGLLPNMIKRLSLAVM